MTRQNISTGASSNDGTGDTLRAAHVKVNSNFVELFQLLGGDSDNLSSQISFDSDSMIFTGTTNLATLGFVDPTSDRAILVPDASGTIIITTATQTLTNKTITTPTINDANSNEILLFGTTASAVNEVTITNAAASGLPVIAATGGDTNVSLSIAGKGTGSVRLSKLALNSSTITAAGAASTTASYIICNSGSALAVSLTDGTVVGETKTFTNRGAGAATITPSNFAPGTTFALAQNAGAQAIWDGANWYLTSVATGVTVT